MSEFRDFDELRAKAPEDKARVAVYRHALEDALRLGELRERQGMTQKDVAEALRVSQTNVSKIERQQEIYVSTVQRYIAALGGELRLCAVLGNDEVPLELPAMKGEPKRSHRAHKIAK